MVAQNLEPAFKATRRTDKDDLDELIDWYEKFKPEAGKVIPIWKTAQQLYKMLDVQPGKGADGKDKYETDLPYRNRTIHAVGPRS